MVVELLDPFEADEDLGLGDGLDRAVGAVGGGRGTMLARDGGEARPARDGPRGGRQKRRCRPMVIDVPERSMRFSAKSSFIRVLAFW